ILTLALIGAIFLRSAVVGYGLYQNRSVLAINFYQVYGLFFWQRVVLGLALTLVLSIMTYFCVRIRSTQSATGILYVVVVFCLIGELIGRYLFLRTGILF